MEVSGDRTGEISTSEEGDNSMRSKSKQQGKGGPGSLLLAQGGSEGELHGKITSEREDSGPREYTRLKKTEEKEPMETKLKM